MVVFFLMHWEIIVGKHKCLSVIAIKPSLLFFQAFTLASLSFQVHVRLPFSFPLLEIVALLIVVVLPHLCFLPFFNHILSIFCITGGCSAQINSLRTSDVWFPYTLQKAVTTNYVLGYSQILNGNQSGTVTVFCFVSFPY